MEADYEKEYVKTGNRGLVVSFYYDFLSDGASAPAFSADKAIAKLTSFSGTVLIKSQGSWGRSRKRTFLSIPMTR